MVKKASNVTYFEGVGRRREAVARVRLYLTQKEKSVTVKNKKIAQGQIVLNGEPIETVFPHDYQKNRFLQPLLLTDSADRFAISIISRGGGTNGQIDAITLGIARALTVVNEEDYKPLLRQHNLLTRDPRARERRKVGTGGKARRQKQSPKR